MPKEERQTRGLHLYASDEEWERINKIIDDRMSTELGKIRAGDVLRILILESAAKK